MLRFNIVDAGCPDISRKFGSLHVKIPLPARNKQVWIGTFKKNKFKYTRLKQTIYDLKAVESVFKLRKCRYLKKLDTISAHEKLMPGKKMSSSFCDNTGIEELSISFLNDKQAIVCRVWDYCCNY